MLDASPALCARHLQGPHRHGPVHHPGCQAACAVESPKSSADPAVDAQPHSATLTGGLDARKCTNSTLHFGGAAACQGARHLDLVGALRRGQADQLLRAGVVVCHSSGGSRHSGHVHPDRVCVRHLLQPGPQHVTCRGQQRHTRLPCSGSQSRTRCAAVQGHCAAKTAHVGGSLAFVGGDNCCEACTAASPGCPGRSHDKQQLLVLATGSVAVHILRRAGGQGQRRPAPATSAWQVPASRAAPGPALC